MDVVLNQAEENFKLPRIPGLERKERIVGGDALIQTFYEGPQKCDCCINWVEREPKEVPEVVKDSRAGELHATGQSVGGHLSGAFDLATDWKAILLLNGRFLQYPKSTELTKSPEADVFLAKRSLNESKSDVVSGKAPFFRGRN